MKALSLSVYSNPMYRKCANGGWSESHDELYVACEYGPWEVDDDSPALFDLVAGPFGTIHLEPHNKPVGMAGPMMGGNYAGTSDGRFSSMCQELVGSQWYGAVAVHDRFETWVEYDALSR